ncbi:MAG: hypothetical protein KDD89_02885 [Anaerolineales bacterium]|nr:hypothetical protein [Anaerolineales bacterium]
MYAITPTLLSPDRYQHHPTLPRWPLWAKWPLVTVVQAPLGAGKTTWLSHELAQHTAVAGRVAWVHLTPLHDLPHAFWSAVLQALQTVQPTLGTAAQRLLQTILLVPNLTFANLLKTELAQQQEPLVLVLDNCEHLQHERIRQSLTFLADELPASVRLVLVSNGESVPISLAGLAARGALWQLPTAVWPPTKNESEKHPQALSPAVRQLVAHTNDWPWLTAELILAAYGAEAAPTWNDLLASGLLREVLVQGQPAFIYEANTAVPRPEPIMLDNTVAQRAVQWFVAHDALWEAYEVAQRAGLSLLLADLLEQEEGLPRLLARGAYDLALHWGTAVSPEVQAQRPLLTIYLAWAHLHQRDYAQAERYCERAEAATKFAVQRGAQQLMTGYLATVRTLLGYATHQYGATLAYAHLALENLPDQMRDVRAYVSICLADVYRRQENYPAARDAFEQVDTLFAANSDPYLVAYGRLAQARLWQEWGQLGRAQKGYDQVIANLRVGQIALESPLLAEAYLGLGQLLYEWNDLTAAYKAITYALMQLPDRPPYLEARLSAYLALVKVYSALDEPVWARLILTHVREKMADVPPVALAETTALQARLDLQTGQVAEAEAWGAAQGLAVSDLLTAVNETIYLTYARLLIAQEEPFVALRLLKYLHDNARAAGRTAGQIQALNGQALALVTQGHPVQGVTKLRAALALGQSERFLRLFVDDGDPMALLLQELAAEDDDTIPADYVDALLRIVSQAPTALQLDGIALPDREADLLSYLADSAASAARATRAASLHMAEVTLAWHEHRLCHRLGVPSVTAVVRRARELGHISVIPTASPSPPI